MKKNNRENDVEGSLYSQVLHYLTKMEVHVDGWMDGWVAGALELWSPPSFLSICLAR